jgi:hypothetical protein
VTPTDLARYEQFLKELAALSRKHNIEISGCGCCGSPGLSDFRPEQLTPTSGYVCAEGTEELTWVNNTDVE